MATVVDAKIPRVCHCGTTMRTKAIHTDVPRSVGVVIGICPECDVRHCSVKSCRALVPDSRATRCPLGHLLDMPGDAYR